MRKESLIIGVLALVLWTALPSGVPAQSPHAHHSAAPAVENLYQAGLSVTGTLKPGEPFTAGILIRDSRGRTVDAFDLFQEKLLHLILVSQELGYFRHLHPEFRGKGRFSLATVAPPPGTYVLFCDYKPKGQPEQVSVLKLSVPGQAPKTGEADRETREKRVDETRVRMILSPEVATTGRETGISFELRQAGSDLPVGDLRPYLGEKGHLVVIRKSGAIEAGDYIHAHATGGNEASVIRFMTRFPAPGLYKLWCQFDRGGRIGTADFWVEVKE